MSEANRIVRGLNTLPMRFVPREAGLTTSYKTDQWRSDGVVAGLALPEGAASGAPTFSASPYGGFHMFRYVTVIGKWSTKSAGVLRSRDTRNGLWLFLPEFGLPLARRFRDRLLGALLSRRRRRGPGHTKRSKDALGSSHGHSSGYVGHRSVKLLFDLFPRGDPAGQRGRRRAIGRRNRIGRLVPGCKILRPEAEALHHFHGRIVIGGPVDPWSESVFRLGKRGCSRSDGYGQYDDKADCADLHGEVSDWSRLSGAVYVQMFMISILSVYCQLVFYCFL